uniref:Uncharacterized protein n=1 Tax=Arundo donax TaxID=35708 RepID=A0A0A9GAW3_ARUDO
MGAIRWNRSDAGNQFPNQNHKTTTMYSAVVSASHASAVPTSVSVAMVHIPVRTRETNSPHGNQES